MTNYSFRILVLCLFASSFSLLTPSTGFSIQEGELPPAEGNTLGEESALGDSKLKEFKAEGKESNLFGAAPEMKVGPDGELIPVEGGDELRPTAPNGNGKSVKGKSSKSKSSDEFDINDVSQLGTLSSSGLYDKSKAQSKTQKSTTWVEGLEQQIKLLSDKKRRTKQERTQLGQLKAELRIAQTIQKQLTKTPLLKTDKLAKGSRGDLDDSFVIAKIEVAAQSKVADIMFESSAGVENNTTALLEYLRATPAGGYRDFRIVSRHKNDGNAEYALAAVRQEYDNAKERERQILEYIKKRNQMLARIAASRRC